MRVHRRALVGDALNPGLAQSSPTIGVPPARSAPSVLLRRKAVVKLVLRPSAAPIRILTERYGDTPPPPMSTPGSRARAIGFFIMLMSVSAGIHSANGGLALLIGVTGVLAGANLIAVGVRAANGPAPAAPAVSNGARAFAAFLRRNVAIVGLVMASCAFIMPVSGDAGPVLCFAMFAVLLTLINLGVRGE